MTKAEQVEQALLVHYVTHLGRSGHLPGSDDITWFTTQCGQVMHVSCTRVGDGARPKDITCQACLRKVGKV